MDVYGPLIMPYRSASVPYKAGPSFWTNDEHYLTLRPNLEGFMKMRYFGQSKYCIPRPGIRGAKSAKFIDFINHFINAGGYENIV